jgi:hypothetical protein
VRVRFAGSKLNLPFRRAQEAASGCPAPARSVSTRSSNVPMAPTGRLWAAKSPRIACLWHHRHVSRGDRNGTQRGTGRPGTTRFPARHGSVSGQAPHLVVILATGRTREQPRFPTTYKSDAHPTCPGLALNFVLIWAICPTVSREKSPAGRDKSPHWAAAILCSSPGGRRGTESSRCLAPPPGSSFRARSPP